MYIYENQKMKKKKKDNLVIWAKQALRDQHIRVRIYSYSLFLFCFFNEKKIYLYIIDYNDKGSVIILSKGQQHIYVAPDLTVCFSQVFVPFPELPYT